MLFLMAPIFGILFILYFAYRWLITKDLRKHKSEMYTGLIFMGVWGVLIFVLSRF